MVIEQWLKNKDTVLFLGVREKINNRGFNSLEFEGIRNEAGRYGGTYDCKPLQVASAAGDMSPAPRSSAMLLITPSVLMQSAKARCAPSTGTPICRAAAESFCQRKRPRSSLHSP